MYADSKASSTESYRWPTPVPCNADIKCISAQSINVKRRSSSFLTNSFSSTSMPSHLLTASTIARPALRAKLNIVKSCSTMPSRASMTKIQTLLSCIACKVFTIENFSTDSVIFLRRRTPAVSIKVYCLSWRSYGI